MKAVLISAAIVIVLMIIGMQGRPAPGSVYHFSNPDRVTNQNAAILVRNEACLSITQSENAIGYRDDYEGNASELYTVAIAKPVIVVSDGKKVGIRDTESDITIFPGDAFLGRSSLRGAQYFETASTGRSWDVRWPINEACGAGLAVIATIDRKLTP